MPPPQKASMQSIDFKEQERARPSGTHSTEVPLRTCPEYAPKDAPRIGTSFACSSSGQNISGISVEPLLRTNAKSQAVTGEPGQAGSAPIASAATTLQPDVQPTNRRINRQTAATSKPSPSFFSSPSGWATDNPALLSGLDFSRELASRRKITGD